MRITENQIRNAALKELYFAKGNALSTTQLIALLTILMQPVGRDAKVLNGRGDTYFSQKVRNLVSHRNRPTGLEQMGLADYSAVSEGWILTALGRKRVASTS